MRLLFRSQIAAIFCAFAVLCGLSAVVVHLEHPELEVCCQEDGPSGKHHHDAAACAICQLIVHASAFVETSPQVLSAPLESGLNLWMPQICEWVPRKCIYFSPRGPPV